MNKNKFTINIIKILILNLFLFLLSCNTENRRELIIKDTDKFTFSTFKNIKSIKFYPLNDFFEDDPVDILNYSNHLILNCTNRSGDEFTYLLDNKGYLENKFLLKGKAGNEILSIISPYFINGNMYFYDITKRCFNWFPVDSIIKNNSYNLNIKKTYLSDSLFFSRIAWQNDSIIFGVGCSTISNKIIQYNIKTKKIIQRFGDFSFNYSESELETLQDAATSYIKIKPDKSRLLLAYRYTDILEIYDINGSQRCSKYGPEQLPLIYQKKSRNGRFYMEKTKDTRKAFVDCYVTDNYIYLLYSGNTRGSKNKIDWICGQSILKLDWDGNEIEYWKLNEPILTFAIDEDKGIIYSHSFSNSNEIIKASIL